MDLENNMGYISFGIDFSDYEIINERFYTLDNKKTSV